MNTRTPSKSHAQWDVLVTTDATISTVVRGVQAGSAEEAGDQVLRDREMLRQQHWELDDANFDSWIHNAYLPDPDDGISPHEPEEPKSKAVLTLFQLASKAYSETTSEEVDLLNYTGSDGLASFLSTEFMDVLKGEADEWAKQRMLGALQVAIDDLDAVYAALNEAS